VRIDTSHQKIVLLKGAAPKRKIVRGKPKKMPSTTVVFFANSESMGDHDSEDHGWREHRLGRRLRSVKRRLWM
jgi:hypothetical protein